MASAKDLAQMPADTDALAELARVEAALAQLEQDQLGDAWQWIKDVSALIKARKMAADIAIRAKRIEARILRRLGEQKGMHSTALYIARNLQAMGDNEFERFLLSLSQHSGVYGDLREWKGKDDRRRRHEAMMERARAGGADDFDERVTVAQAANRLIADIISEGDTLTTSDAIEVLGEMCDLDPREEVNRRGLQYLLRRAAATAEPEHDRWTRWDGESGAAPLVGYIPAAVTYQVDGQWVRSAWSAASVEQLAANVAMVEAQAAERVEAAEKMRGLLGQLRAVPVALGLDDIDDSAKASDVLMLGRVNGLIGSGSGDTRGATYADAAKAFPRLFQNADGHLSRHLVAMVDRLAEFGVTDESQLDEATAERLEDHVWTGSNGASMKAYTAAYLPNSKRIWLGHAHYVGGAA